MSISLRKIKEIKYFFTTINNRGRNFMKNIDKLNDAFYKIQCMNWIKSMGKGYSAAGKTLENVLGKKDDCDSLPDFDGIELKTKMDGADSYIGLVSMVPDSEPLLINRLLNNYGWPSRKDKNFKVFYAQIYGNVFNSVGYYFSYKLFVNYDLKRVELLIKNNFTCDIDSRISWSFEQISLRLNKKLTLLALFNVKKFYVPEKDSIYFKYYKMTVYKFKCLDSFLSAIENGYVRMNIKISFYDKEPYYGKLHNKGTTFEIMEENLTEIFDVVNLE